MSDATKQQLAVIEQHFKPLVPRFAEVLKGTKFTAPAMVTSIMWAIEQNHSLQESTIESLLRFGMTVSSLVLEPNPQLGQVFALPFKKKGQYVAQTCIGYKGYSTLGWRDRIAINGNVVREHDHIEVVEGTAGAVEHRRALTGRWTDKKIIGAWATATSKGYAPIVAYMDIDEIIDLMNRSPAVKASAETPWKDEKIGFPAMATKSVKRRLARSLPMGAFTMAARMEEAFEEQGKDSWIEPGKGVVVEGKVEAPEPVAPRMTDAEAAAIGKRRTFAIKKPNGLYLAASIEEWYAKMKIAIDAIAQRGPGRDMTKAHQNLVTFRELNDGVIDELNHDFPRETKEIGAYIEQRLKDL